MRWPRKFDRVDLGPIYETSKGLFCDSFTVSRGRKGKKVFTYKVRLTLK